MPRKRRETLPLQGFGNSWNSWEDDLGTFIQGDLIWSGMVLITGFMMLGFRNTRVWEMDGFNGFVLVIHHKKIGDGGFPQLLHGLFHGISF